MVFSSSIFVFAFLPITLIAYYVANLLGKSSFKNGVLLVASIIFYAWGGIKFLLLLLILICINYVLAILIGRCKKYGKVFLVLAIGADLLNLGYFKYFNFLIENVKSFSSAVLHKEVLAELPNVVLPIGISFFTFQIMSYVIDVYRKEVPVQKNLAKLALYVMMFPQLIAGPIVRYKDVNLEIDNRKSTVSDVERGMKRFIIGFAKKVFLANSMGSVADITFAACDGLNSVYAWLGAICYSFQIFYDFSAYSDMAIGLGWIFGFHFNENFNYPYISKSIKEFWRRWHISLSSWFRDYVYIPLGGNRKGQIRTYINLGIVFLLTGIWHGAAWQFVIWGIYHGIFLIIERVGFGKLLEKIPGFFQHIYTMFVVIIGWVFFRADNLSQALLYLKSMFSFNFDEFKNYNIVLSFNHVFIVCLVISILCIAPVASRIGKMKIIRNQTVNRILYMMLWIGSVIYMIGLSYNPFIYFQF